MTPTHEQLDVLGEALYYAAFPETTISWTERHDDYKGRWYAAAKVAYATCSPDTDMAENLLDGWNNASRLLQDARAERDTVLHERNVLQVRLREATRRLDESDASLRKITDLLTSAQEDRKRSRPTS